MRKGRTGAAAHECAPAVEPDAPYMPRELREEMCEDGLRRRSRGEEDELVALHSGKELHVWLWNWGVAAHR